MGYDPDAPHNPSDVSGQYLRGTSHPDIRTGLWFNHIEVYAARMIAGAARSTSGSMPGARPAVYPLVHPPRKANSMIEALGLTKPLADGDTSVG